MQYITCIVKVSKVEALDPPDASGHRAVFVAMSFEKYNSANLLRQVHVHQHPPCRQSALWRSHRFSCSGPCTRWYLSTMHVMSFCVRAVDPPDGRPAPPCVCVADKFSNPLSRDANSYLKEAGIVPGPGAYITEISSIGTQPLSMCVAPCRVPASSCRVCAR